MNELKNIRIDNATLSRSTWRDAEIVYAEHLDSTPLTQEELAALNKTNKYSILENMLALMKSAMAV